MSSSGQAISRKIKASIARSFAPAGRAAATTLISDLIERYVGREIEWVLAVVLAIADGDLASLADGVRLAQGDYRDVLALEEFTGTGKLRSEPARVWLEKYFAQFGTSVPKGLR